MGNKLIVSLCVAVVAETRKSLAFLVQKYFGFNLKLKGVTLTHLTGISRTSVGISADQYTLTTLHR